MHALPIYINTKVPHDYIHGKQHLVIGTLTYCQFLACCVHLSMFVLREQKIGASVTVCLPSTDFTPPLQWCKLGLALSHVTISKEFILPLPCIRISHHLHHHPPDICLNHHQTSSILDPRPFLPSSTIASILISPLSLSSHPFHAQIHPNVLVHIPHRSTMSM